MANKRRTSVLGLAPALERIYMLLDPRDRAVHYIGHTRTPLAQRLCVHMDVLEPKNVKEAWVFGLQKLRMRPIISEIAKLYPNQIPEDEEAFWIRHYISNGCILFNTYTPGLPPEIKRKFTVDEMVALTEGKRIF